MNLIGASRAKRIIAGYAGWIGEVSLRYGVPAAAIKAILFQEMTMINLGDVVADVAVRLRLLGKRDSSTGYAQIFGWVGVNAANFCVDRGLATYASLGIKSDHRLDPENADDVRRVWLKLRRNPKANIEFATMNLLAAADQMTGGCDFSKFSDGDMKLVFSRYNANTDHVTLYGERAFVLYKGFLEAE